MMRSLRLCLLLLLLPALAAAQPPVLPTPVDLRQISGATVGRVCDRPTSSVVISTASSGSTQLVALTSGQTIYVCGYAFVSTSALAVKFVYGTSTSCSGSPADLTGAMAVAANGGVAVPAGPEAIFATAASNALCINLSGTTQVSGHLTYVKF